MSKSLAAPALDRVTRLWQSPIGKKAVMAVTGLVLFGYTVGHMAGNLQFFAGAEKIDAYARFLHSSAGLLWGVRALLLVSIALHVLAAVQLVTLSRAARPVAYRKRANVAGNLGSRTMAWTGVILLGFIVFHILHLTTGDLHPDFVPLAPYHNLMVGLRQVPVGIFYLVAMACLVLHLFHGVYSLFQSLGATHPSYTPKIKMFAMTFAVIVAAGFASVPVAVLARLVD